MFQIQVLMEGHVEFQNSVMYRYEVDLDEGREKTQRQLMGEKSLKSVLHGV